MAKNNYRELEEPIREIVCNVNGLETEDVTLETHFYKDLGIDSIKGVEMAVALQEKYDIRIDDAILPKLTNLKLVIEEVDRLLNKKKK